MIIKTLRTRLRTDATLQTYWQANYGKDAKHFIGYKRAPSTTDLPAISYIDARKTLAGDLQDSHLISLVVQINEPGITDDVFDGVSRLNEIVDIIVGIMENYDASPDCHWVEGPITVTSDLQLRHPFHECEIQFTLKTQ